MHGYLFALAHQYGRIAHVRAGMCWSEEKFLNVESAMTIRQTCVGLMCQCLAVSVPLVSVLACSAKSMHHKRIKPPTRLQTILCKPYASMYIQVACASIGFALSTQTDDDFEIVNDPV